MTPTKGSEKTLLGNESGPMGPKKQRAGGALLLPSEAAGCDGGPHIDIFIIISNLNMPYLRVYLVKVNTKKSLRSLHYRGV